MNDLRRLLRGNLAVRALLFSRAVFLLEGETELGALSVWGVDLARQDIALYHVGGKGNFVAPLKLIHHFNIPWAILGDGEVLWDLAQRGREHGPSDHIRTILAVTQHSLPTVPGDPGAQEEDFTRWRAVLERYGIFSLANTAHDGFERAIQQEIDAALWRSAQEQFGSNKVARGRYIAENSACPERVEQLIRRMMLRLREQGADIRLP